MKKIMVSILILLASVNISKGCTLCGCSASNQYLGILPQSHNNFVGLQFQNRYFTSLDLHAMEEEPGAVSKQYYNTLQLWGRYNVGRVQIFTFVPYLVNKHIETPETNQVTGLGDITLLANVRLLGNNCTGKPLGHYLQVGGGVKLPTGKYKRNEILYEGGLPNMQPGTHSFDFIANLNYTIMYQGVGINIDGSYTFTTANRDDYKFGNRASMGVLGFYSYRQQKLTIVPQAGLRYDLTAGDYDHYSVRMRDDDMTGGYQLYASLGCQVYYRQFGLQIGYHKPVSQHYADGMVISKYRTEAGIYFLF